MNQRSGNIAPNGCGKDAVALERENAPRAGELISIADAVQVQAPIVFRPRKMKLLALPTKIAVPYCPSRCRPGVEVYAAVEEVARPERLRQKHAAVDVFVGPRPEFITQPTRTSVFADKG